MYKYK
jgi:hypothetical protein